MDIKCPVCGQNGSFRCGKCKSVYYCGRKCQTEHFKTHKHNCRKPSEVGEASHNLLTSLPSCLMCAIVSDWLTLKSFVVLDAALCNRGNRFQLLDALRCDQFTIPMLKPLDSDMSDPDPSKPTSDTKRLHWLLLRGIIVKEFDFAYGCDANAITDYLKKFGKFVQRVTHYTPTRFPSGKLISGGQLNFLAIAGVPGTYASGPRPGAQSQSSAIAKHSKNLTSYFCRMLNNGDAGFLRVLKNNPRLVELHIQGDLCGRGNAEPFAHIQLPNLRQLQFEVKWGFDEVLLAVVKTAPNMQKLSIACNPSKCTEIDGALILDLARACSKLRSFGSIELDVGPEDTFLKQVLQVCPDVINLDLYMHQNLTDDVFISALATLKELRCINLSYCAELTDRTLRFLTERFAHTLEVLHVGGSKGMSAEGIADLRARCTRLHAFHYCLQLHGGDEERSHSDVLMATFAKVYYGDKVFDVVKSCPNLKVLDVSSHINVTEGTLLEVAQSCPKLHTVVVSSYKRNKPDFSNVKKAFPTLLFTCDESTSSFDVLKMPV